MNLEFIETINTDVFTEIGFYNGERNVVYVNDIWFPMYIRGASRWVIDHEHGAVKCEVSDLFDPYTFQFPRKVLIITFEDGSVVRVVNGE